MEDQPFQTILVQRGWLIVEQEDQTSIEGNIASLTNELETHKDIAQGSHQYYTEVAKQGKKDWEQITQLEEKDDRQGE